MKTNYANKKTTIYSFLMCLLLILCSCNQDDKVDIKDDEPKGYISISTLAWSPDGNEESSFYLGRGYDCRYDLAERMSFEGLKYYVFDLEQYDGSIDVKELPKLAEVVETYGSTYADFEKNLSSRISSDLLLHQFSFMKWGATYSSKRNPWVTLTPEHSFYKTDLCRIIKKVKLDVKDASSLKPFLTNSFKAAIELKDAKNIVGVFGTHVMTEVSVGVRLSVFVSANVSKSNQGEFIQLNSDIISLLMGDLKNNKVNVKNMYDISVYGDIYGGPEFFGKYVHISNEGSVYDLDLNWNKWSEEVAEKHSRILYSPINTLIPIWDFIDDPQLKQEVINEILYRTKELPVVDIILTKWDDVLYVNTNEYTNGGYDIVSYQWFMDDVLIPESDNGTAHYLPIGDKLPFNKPYYCILYTRYNETIKTAPVIPTKQKNLTP